jgi:hypothetical protein
MSWNNEEDYRISYLRGEVKSILFDSEKPLTAKDITEVIRAKRPSLLEKSFDLKSEPEARVKYVLRLVKKSLTVTKAGRLNAYSLTEAATENEAERREKVEADRKRARAEREIAEQVITEKRGEEFNLNRGEARVKVEAGTRGDIEVKFGKHLKGVRDDINAETERRIMETFGKDDYYLDRRVEPAEIVFAEKVAAFYDKAPEMFDLLKWAKKVIELNGVPVAPGTGSKEWTEAFDKLLGK